MIAAPPGQRIHGSCRLRDAELGAWVHLGPNTSVLESTVGDYTYTAGDVSVVYADVADLLAGRSCWDVADCFSLAETAPPTTLAPLPGRRVGLPCVDYVLSVAWPRRRHPRVAARVALDEPRDGVYTSDHFAVVADVELA